MTLRISDILEHTFITSVEAHETLGSTNTRALELARRDDLQLPFLVITEHQTAGRGRGANQWRSTPGALTFSVIVDPAQFALDVRRWSMISLATGLAVRDALAEFSREDAVQLKWPNDVYTRGRKISGILIETSFRGPRLPARCVIGIGINVNNTWTPASMNGRGDLANTAVSLVELTGSQIDRTEVLCVVLRQLRIQLETLGESPQRVTDAWRQHSLLAGRLITVESGTRIHRGHFRDLAPDGSLLLDPTDQAAGSNLDTPIAIRTGSILTWQ